MREIDRYLRQEFEDIEVWYVVEYVNPADEELAHEGIDDVDALAQQRYELLNVEAAALGHNVLDELVEQLRATLDVRIGIGRELA